MSQRTRLIEALTEGWEALHELGELLTAQDWLRPTCLPGWSVRDQFAHILGTEAMLEGQDPPEQIAVPTGDHVRNEIGRVNEIWILGLRELSVDELLQRFHAVVASRRQRLEAMDESAFAAASWTPAGHDTFGRFMQIRVFDTWMHEQDIREAVARPGHQRGLAAEVALDEVTHSMPYVIAKRASAPRGALVEIALTGDLAREIRVAVEDRAAVVSDFDRSPTARIELDGLRFMRWIGGRVTPRLDEVSCRGDREFCTRLVENLAYTI
jgi:uncharacterized protein (TIGR03083 family)